MGSEVDDEVFEDVEEVARDGRLWWAAAAGIAVTVFKMGAEDIDRVRGRANLRVRPRTTARRVKSRVAARLLRA